MGSFSSNNPHKNILLLKNFVEILCQIGERKKATVGGGSKIGSDSSKNAKDGGKGARS